MPPDPLEVRRDALLERIIELRKIIKEEPFLDDQKDMSKKVDEIDEMVQSVDSMFTILALEDLFSSLEEIIKSYKKKS